MIKISKQIFKDKHNNKLFCEICGFDFEKIYGSIGNDFIECHHIILVSTMNEGGIMKKEDVEMLCSNCHSMIHRNSLLSVEDLKKCMGNNMYKNV